MSRVGDPTLSAGDDAMTRSAGDPSPANGGVASPGLGSLGLFGGIGQMDLIHRVIHSILALISLIITC